ncbi:MAG: hypothetical protein ACYS47_01415 [Planctomycetota bacterium]|jgi:hypothetical protein
MRYLTFLAVLLILGLAAAALFLAAPEGDPVVDVHPPALEKPGKERPSRAADHREGRIDPTSTGPRIPLPEEAGAPAAQEEEREDELIPVLKAVSDRMKKRLHDRDTHPALIDGWAEEDRDLGASLLAEALGLHWPEILRDGLKRLGGTKAGEYILYLLAQLGRAEMEGFVLERMEAWGEPDLYSTYFLTSVGTELTSLKVCELLRGPWKSFGEEKLEKEGRRVLIYALLRQGGDGIPAEYYFERFLNASTSLEKTNALKELANVCVPEILPRLDPLIREEPDPEIRRWGLRAMARAALPTGEEVKRLGAHLAGDPDPGIRLWIVSLLVEKVPPWASTLGARYFFWYPDESPNPYLLPEEYGELQSRFRSLYHRGHRDHLLPVEPFHEKAPWECLLRPVQVAARADTDPGVRRKAVEGLYSLGWPLLGKVGVDRSREIRRLLGEIAVSDPDPGVRKEARKQGEQLGQLLDALYPERNR